MMLFLLTIAILLICALGELVLTRRHEERRNARERAATLAYLSDLLP